MHPLPLPLECIPAERQPALHMPRMRKKAPPVRVQVPQAAEKKDTRPIIGQKVRFVKMYKCDTCGRTFDFPRIRTFSELIDGENREWRKEIYCPDCGSPDFKEAEDV